MSYLALRLAVDADVADAWSDALLASGAFSVDAADAGAGTDNETPIYAEPRESNEAPERSSTPPLWPVTQLTALFDPAHDPDAALQHAAASLMQPAPPHVAFAVPEQDWVTRSVAQIPEVLKESNRHGVGREMFAAFRRNALTAEEGACTWL